MTFKFRHFNFSGLLNITPTGSLSGTSKMLSVLNLEESLLCSPPDINQPFDPASPILNVDADGHFAYEVVNNNGEMDIITNGANVFRILEIIKKIPDKLWYYEKPVK